METKIVAEKKETFVKLRVTRGEYKYLQDLAVARGTDLSKMVREVLNENLLVGHTDDAKQREP